ncbi:hypothetical protein WA026_016479 [Henosepilachna vigintioctopunctata]|uniref:Lipase domain-containing protein n=1 Tax=Henosepilachna vigintioctopunctata TaxID=420089 RepID=A0AAW1UK44_9CUCU
MVELSSDSKIQSTKVSVTFADDIEELVERQDSYQIPPMENRQNQNRSEVTPDSDGEDYSASVNAIIQRRASTRRSKKRRDSRRASSPFSPDVLPSSGNDRRRSSVFTTSSGDTAITVEDTIAPEVSQDQIFENIKLHEEVLQNVKMQPWDMRKKMKLVLQAKAYIKRHEGALQERLAQNGSTRDRLARCYIFFLKKWQNSRREISNILNWFIPWEQKVKEIESHFGSVVASYFLFIRWLFWVNIVIAGILVCFVAIPEVSSSDLDVADELVEGDDELLNNSRYDDSLPTTLLIHGWTHGKDTPWVAQMREAMANLKIWNIIVVDWASISRTLYSEARILSPLVGKRVGLLCLYLNQKRGLRISDIHLVGHSMGAQVSAMASALIRKELHEKVGRITGLDPAAPLYEWPRVDSDEVIDESDAIFVDIIHTNGHYLGMISPCGHVDFYPNGGMHQPGCNFWLCSHMRAVEFWLASIANPFLFKAYAFSSWGQYAKGKLKNLPYYPMGIAADSSIPKGVYFLETVDEMPYIHTKTTMIDSL